MVLRSNVLMESDKAQLESLVTYAIDPGYELYHFTFDGF